MFGRLFALIFGNLSSLCDHTSQKLKTCTVQLIQMMGKPFQAIETSRDRSTGVPVRIYRVDSVKVSRAGQATAFLLEADVEGTHFQGVKWWLRRDGSQWKLDATRVVWIN